MTTADQVSSKATPEQILDRVREWIISNPVDVETKFGDGYRQALRDVRSLIANHSHSDRVEPMNTVSGLNVEQEDALWDATVPPGGVNKEREVEFTSVAVHKRVCILVSKMLDEATIGYRQIIGELRSQCQEWLQDYNSSSARKVLEIIGDEVPPLGEGDIQATHSGEQLAALINDVIDIAQHWAVSDHPPTKVAGNTILQLVVRRTGICEFPHTDRASEEECERTRLDDPNSVTAPSWIRQQYLNILGQAEYELTEEEQAKLADKLVSFRDRQVSMLRQRLELSVDSAGATIREADVMEAYIDQLTHELNSARVLAEANQVEFEEFRRKTADFLVDYFIEGKDL